jgi:DNA-directed RNA polymerase subunit RPC12/RpoP
MGLACPGCGAPVTGSPERRLLRCPRCGGRIRSRPLRGEGERAYEVELLGKVETRRRIEVPWTSSDDRRLQAWLLWSSVVTVGLAAVLYALARFWR